jgi:hypothetical protein
MLSMGSFRMWQPFTLTQQSWIDSLLPRKSAPDSTSQPGWVTQQSWTNVWLKRTASMIVLGVLFLGSSEFATRTRGPLSRAQRWSREQWICPTLLGQRERLPRTGTAHSKRTRDVSCWSGFPLQGIHRFKSPQLSDMSNRLSRGRLHVAK